MGDPGESPRSWVTSPLGWQFLDSISVPPGGAQRSPARAGSGTAPGRKAGRGRQTRVPGSPQRGSQDSGLAGGLAAPRSRWVSRGDRRCGGGGRTVFPW